MTDDTLQSTGAIDEDSSATETWRTISGSDGLYSVSSNGRIRSHFHGRIRVLACCHDSKGYRQFAMSLPGSRRLRMKVHRAVALNFLGPRPPGAQINHISGDKEDNSVANLEYVSCRENVRHAWDKGLRTPEQVQGERHGRSKLTNAQVRNIRVSHGDMTARELAIKHGVSTQCINLILNYKTWQHVA